MTNEDYISKNKKSWNERVSIHLQSDFYDVKGFLQGKSSLKPIELELLGNVKDKTLLHLMCHFGQDSISLARLGALVTGIDFSDKAIEAARDLASKTNTGAQFICSDLYALPEYLDKHFDIVFMSYGTIGWLPDLDKWAYMVSKYLVAGGVFVLVDFHPVVWMFDNDFKEVHYNYFNKEPIVEMIEGTYTDRNAGIKSETISWNHSLSEIINSLIGYGMQIERMDEFDYSPYDCFKETIEITPGQFRIKHLGDKIPMLYAIKAIKKTTFRKSYSRGI